MAEFILILVRETRNNYKSSGRGEWRLRPSLKKKKT
jgi:hypothetical protein